MDRHVKTSGQVYTPAHIVSAMLDYCGYEGAVVLQRHVIDNSCGAGAFLCEVACRYCRVFVSVHGTVAGLRTELENYVHGIEIDGAARADCIVNLDAAVERWVKGVQWDIVYGDALSVTRFNGQMDYVVGNPPYVRVHNLADSYNAVKTFAFACGGMTDLYLAFFEIGLRMLSDVGKLCYITPVSWLGSLAAANMRRYIRQHACLTGIIDLGHYQPFAATTYTAVTLLDKAGGHYAVDYSVYDTAESVVRHVDSVALSDMYIDGAFYMADNRTLTMLRDILLSRGDSYVKVKNGFATLCDHVFIRGKMPFREFVIPVIKASTGKWAECLFPYDENGKPLPMNTLFAVNAVADYLTARKSDLLKGRSERECADWYLYGRTQALKDVFSPKLAVSPIVKDSPKLNASPAGTGVYGGLYILSREPEKEIARIVASEEFIDYVKALKGYKSGGYYTFNARALETYLNYSISKEHGKIRRVDPKQQGLFERNIDFF